jgi:hypothetical protein
MFFPLNRLTFFYVVAQSGMWWLNGNVVAQSGMSWLSRGCGGKAEMWWLSGDVVAKWGCGGSAGMWWLSGDVMAQLVDVELSGELKTNFF